MAWEACNKWQGGSEVMGRGTASDTREGKDKGVMKSGKGKSGTGREVAGEDTGHWAKEMAGEGMGQRR